MLCELLVILWNKKQDILWEDITSRGRFPTDCKCYPTRFHHSHRIWKLTHTGDIYRGSRLIGGVKNGISSSCVYWTLGMVLVTLILISDLRWSEADTKIYSEIISSILAHQTVDNLCCKLITTTKSDAHRLSNCFHIWQNTREFWKVPRLTYFPNSERYLSMSLEGAFFSKVNL